MAQIKPLKQTPPPQEQPKQPGEVEFMRPHPIDELPDYRPSGKLQGKVAFITGADSGIGRAVAILYAKEGADIAFAYLNEHQDAETTKKRIEELGRQCFMFSGDLGNENFCIHCVEETVRRLGHLDILVNHAGEQHAHENLEEISSQEFERTFRTNMFSYFYMTKAALKHLGEGSTIINTASVTAYKGKAELIDYSATKGANVALTRSLAASLSAKRKIRVNGVAPGPVWTPLIPSSFSAEQVQNFGANTYLGRPAQPAEIAPCYVFLASSDSVFITGQMLHPNGGQIVS